MSRLRLVCLVFALCIVGFVVHGQTANPDIYAYLNGDIWKYSIHQNTATQITGSGYNGGPVLSPDGSRIAYLETSATFLSQFNSGAASQFDGSPPTDIWIFDITRQAFSLVARQAGASSAGFLRSFPTWSPDGRQLAWLQIDPNVQSLERATLQIYNLDTGLITRLVDDVNLGYQESSITMPILLWGGGGIARLLLAYLPGSQSPFLYMEVFNPADGRRSQFNLELAEDWSNMVRDFMWASHLGSPVLLLGIADYWEALDPADGSRSRLIDPPRLRNRWVAGGLELLPVAAPREGGGWQFDWQAQSGGITYDIGYSSRDVDFDSQPVLSSDGWQVAWHSGDRISIWHTGMAADARPLASDVGAYKLFPIPDPVSLAWAPLEWTTTGGTAAVQAASTSIPERRLCTLAPQLSVGGRAIVSPGLANRVRSAASLNAEVLGTIKPGEAVDVLQGPVCNSGYYWYRIQNERISGWTVEGIGEEYWLFYHVDCSNSPPTRLAIGMTAIVTPGQANNIRDGAGTAGTNIVGRMPAGSSFVITGHAQCDADGLRWYPIQFGGISGWTAAGSGEEYWIEPAETQAAG